MRLIDSHVVVLGAGGLGSAVVQNLAGLGVSALTLLDFDLVELRNFARQFTYTEAQRGLPKVEQVAAWVHAFDSRIEVTAVNDAGHGPDDVRALLSGADLVVSAIDDPDEVDLWVNEACVGAGVPFIRGGLSYVQGLYWSVDPGRSACRHCLELHRAASRAGRRPPRRDLGARAHGARASTARSARSHSCSARSWRWRRCAT